MGVVWLARDEKLGEDIALKFLPDIVRWDPAAIAELKAETRRARQLTHPHIVRIHDLVEDAYGAAIAMEAIEGRTLTEERLSRATQVLEPSEILAWLPQLAAALDYAHREARIVHRDIKPSNVMLTRDGRIKVTDFGVARAMGESMLRVSQLHTGGTLLYMSPQQAMGEMPTERDDIYALGSTLYELLTGKPPFHTGNVAAQIERRRPDSIAERRRQLGVSSAGAIPKKWEEVIAACLAKHPEERPASAGEVAALLTAPVQSGASLKLGGRARALAVCAGMLGVVAAGAWQAGWWQKTITALGAESTPSVSTTQWKSDATRAYAAWNFDGDGREASGRDWELRRSKVFPVADRLGRPDRALFLNGSSALSREGVPVGAWSADRPFTISLWVKPETASESATLVSLRNERQLDGYWLLSTGPDGPQMSVGRLQQDSPDVVAARQALLPGRWSHLAVRSDSREMALFVDGQEAARVPLVRNRDARLTMPAALRVGHMHPFDLGRFAGAVDELRWWQRALEPGEIKHLAARSAPPRFLITSGVYAATDDLAAASKREFGAEAELADWNELKEWHRDDIEAWCDEVRLMRFENGALLQSGGQRHSKAPRHYFLTRFDGVKPDYFLAHDELGGLRLALGSWHGMSQQVLVRLPAKSPRREDLPAQSGKIVREWTHAAENSRALASMTMEWREELNVGIRKEVRVEAVMRDGRRIAAVCVPLDERTLALVLGDADRPEMKRQLPATFGPLEFTFAVRDGRIVFRAISPIGSSPLFQEELMGDYHASQVLRLTLLGVDSATLTTEE